MPRFTREEIAAKKATIVKGMRVTHDCAITTPYSRTETPLEEARRRMTKAVDMAEQLAVALRAARH